MSTPENSSPDPLARGLSKDELAAIEAAKGKQAQTPPPAPAEPRKVYLDQVGLMAWHGLMAMAASAHRRVAEIEEAEKKAHEARALSLMTHLGALDILTLDGPQPTLEFEHGKPYLVARPAAKESA